MVVNVYVIKLKYKEYGIRLSQGARHKDLAVSIFINNTFKIILALSISVGLSYLVQKALIAGAGEYVELMSEIVSDSFIAIDESFNVVELNELFLENFVLKKDKYTNLRQILVYSNIAQYRDELEELINDSKENNIRSMEILLNAKDGTKYFEVKANPIIMNTEYFGTVLLFKDITVYKKNLELIKQNQFQIIERERLISLNQIIGGVAHNLKTPILSSAGGISIIKRDTGRLHEYIQNKCGDSEEITKIIDEINDWENRIKEYLIYMSDVLTTVKGQVTEYSQISEESFSIKEAIDKITILMAFEFKKNNCIFITELSIDCSKKIKGDVNSLIQVLNNIISNSIEVSKEGEKIILGAFKESNNVVFYVRNYG